MSCPQTIPYDWMLADFLTPDPGTAKTIAPNKGITVFNLEIAASASETNFLAAPVEAGQFLTIVAWQVGSGGTRVVTLADSGAFLGTTQTAITFSAVGQVTMLYSVQSGTSFKWAIIPLVNQPLAGSLYQTFMPLAAQQALSGAGAINITSYYTAWTTTAANAGTLANGVQIGQRKRVQQIVDGGDGTLTPTSLSGGTTITFADAGDFAELVWNGTAWVAVQLGNDADGATAPVLA
jgi:hypothetical protein